MSARAAAIHAILGAFVVAVVCGYQARAALQPDDCVVHITADVSDADAIDQLTDCLVARDP